MNMDLWKTGSDFNAALGQLGLDEASKEIFKPLRPGAVGNCFGGSVTHIQLWLCF